MPLSDLRDLVARHARSGTKEIAAGVHISQIDRMGPPEFTTTGSLFVMLAQGAKQLAVGNRVHTYGAGDALIVPLDLPMTGHFTEASREAPALGFSMVLRPEVIAELLLLPQAKQLGARGSDAKLPPGIMVSAASAPLVDAVARYVTLVERPVDLPVLGPLVEREIHWLLLQSQHGDAVRQLGIADSGLSRVGHAVRWLRAHYDQAIRVDELARMSAMSTSAFHRGFQEVTALSPIQFQKQLRLQEARIRLVAGAKDVAGVAHDVGYESASQFSRDYRQRFGAPPLQDARLLRTAP